jgi:hypothetical protein
LSGSKIFFIFLILVVVLFVVVEVIGAHNNSTAQPGSCDAAPNKKQCEQDSFNSSGGQDHSTLQSMSTVLEPFSPKVQVKPKTFTLNSSTKKEQNLSVAADDSHSFRMAQFTLLPKACGTVTYQASGNVPTAFKDFSPQVWPGKADPSKPAKLIILKTGGTLDFELKPGAKTCAVTSQ